jgi:hypothetical protein
VSLIFFETRETPLIEPADFDPVETVTRRLTPPHLRRPLALANPVQERASFAGLTDSGEVPLLGIDPAETARISIPVTYGSPAEPVQSRRPWWFRGTRRLTRSRALLLAATCPGGLR